MQKKSSKNKFWNFSIWDKLDQTLVREIAVRWNQTELSILLMYQKLVEVGLVDIHKDRIEEATCGQ
jgi:hypothetical protein